MSLNFAFFFWFIFIRARFLVSFCRDGQAKTSNMMKALAMRVGFSIVVFLCVLLAWKLGYIQPSGIPAGH